MDYAPDLARIATPIGRIAIVGDAQAISAIRIADDGALNPGSAPAVRQAAEQLAAFFAGRLVRFDLSLVPAATARGQALRDGIVGIAYGQTASYGALARLLESSARAVGQACARNRFPIVVPCHRILAAGGVLGPYSAGDGPTTKRWLLDLEQRGA